jgi:hypothetical protein
MRLIDCKHDTLSAYAFFLFFSFLFFSLFIHRCLFPVPFLGFHPVSTAFLILSLICPRWDGLCTVGESGGFSVAVALAWALALAQGAFGRVAMEFGN